MKLMTSILWSSNLGYMQGIYVLGAEPNGVSHFDSLSQLFFCFVFFGSLEVLLPDTTQVLKKL